MFSVMVVIHVPKGRQTLLYGRITVTKKKCRRHEVGMTKTFPFLKNVAFFHNRS